MNDAVTNADRRAAPILQKIGLCIDARGRVTSPLAVPLHGAALASFNPANGRALGSVTTATPADLDALLAGASEASRAWRDTPAPRRGNAVRG